MATTCGYSIKWRPFARATTRTLTPVPFAIPSYNLRKSRVYPYPEPQLKGYHSESQLKETTCFSCFELQEPQF